MDVTPFLSQAGTFASESSFDTLFANLTDLLIEVANYAPDAIAGDTSTSLSGLFEVVDGVSNFSSALVEFLDLVNQIAALIPPGKLCHACSDYLDWSVTNFIHHAYTCFSVNLIQKFAVW